MFYSYIQIAVRNMMRNKSFTLINLLGLSIGIGCCLLLVLYVTHEYSYDKHHDNAGNLYRINTVFKSADGEGKMRTSSPPVAMTMMEEVAGIASAARVLDPPNASQSLVKYEDQLHYESHGLIADSTVFQLFNYEFIEGDRTTALNEPNSVAISSGMAARLFGNKSPIDKIISITQGGDPNDFRVTGVFREQPLSIIEANFFTSMSSNGWAEYLRSPGVSSEWVGNNFIPSYVRLHPNEDPEKVTEKMNVVLMKYAGADLKAAGREKRFELERVSDIYLKSDVGQSPRITYVRIVLGIGIFILLIACINFMNLSTARAMRRSAEIGVRKTIGALRSSLIRQVMTESMVIVLIAALIGVAIAAVSLDLFNQLTGLSVTMDNLRIEVIILSLTAVVLITGVLAGAYPAFYLSSFQPAQVLKGRATSQGATWLRRSLVVFQFMIASLLICGTIVMMQQMDFIRSKSLGFNADAKIILPLRSSEARAAYPSIKQKLSQNPDIIDVTATAFVAGDRILYDGGIYKEGTTVEDAIQHQINPVDENYMNVMNIELISGKPLISDQLNAELNASRVIINETSAAMLGFTPSSAIGQKLYSQNGDQRIEREIVGVMKDFHQTNLHEKITPTLFYVPGNNDDYGSIVASVQASNIKNVIESIDHVWSASISNTPFEFHFLDESIQRQYEFDRRNERLIKIFSAIAISISCLGLYALSAFMTERRQREIGVRKVMGASAGQVAMLMSSEYLKLIAIALVISIPFAWIGASSWLESFAYRMPTGISPFIFTAVTVVVIALLTVGFETIKAAVANPVKSLKAE